MQYLVYSLVGGVRTGPVLQQLVQQLAREHDLTLGKCTLNSVLYLYNVHIHSVHHRGKRLQRCQQGRPSPFVPINVHSYL